ncbi:MAG: hypothetical protein KF821_05590 [Anaerolineales bacterium]|jgi:hypothetical protein|nr:hypothetical protein [Anaerolineales bacterium]
MASSSSTTTAFTYGKQGAEFGALLALGYYLVVVALLTAVGNADKAELFSIAPIHTFLSFAVVGLVAGLPATLAAMSLGFITGLAIPKLLAIVGPRSRWQSALVGVIFSGVITLAILGGFGFRLEAIVWLEVPLLIYVAATTYLSMRLFSNKDAVNNLLPRIKGHPVIIWFVVAGFAILIFYFLIDVIAAWF